MAWNQPMLRNEKGYVLGVSVSKKHLTVAPFGGDALAAVADRLAKYTVNKKTFQVPLDWKVDAALLRAIVKARLAEMG